MDRAKLRGSLGDVMDAEKQVVIPSEGEATRSVKTAVLATTTSQPSRKWLGVTVLTAVGCILGAVGLILGSLALAKNYNNDTLSSFQTAPNTDSSASSTVNQTASLLDTILDRGYLTCGVFVDDDSSLPQPVLQPGLLQEAGMDPETLEPLFEGLEVDLCRAVASALFRGTRVLTSADDQVSDVDAGRYRIRPASSTNEAWVALNSTAVDLLFRVPNTLAHDVYVDTLRTGVEFTFPYFYNALGVGGEEDFVSCIESQTYNGTTCSQLQLCVPEGLPLDSIVLGQWRVPDSQIVPLGPANPTSIAQAFNDGQCNVVAGDRWMTSKRLLRSAGYTGSFLVSTEIAAAPVPYSMASRQGEDRWRDFLETVWQALRYSEAEEITQAMAHKLPTTLAFGSNFEAILQQAVVARGNYGEIYERHLQDFVPRSGLNVLNSFRTNAAPMIWGGFPLTTVTKSSSSAMVPNLDDASPTVRAIRERGYLRCGKVDYVGFSELDPVRKEYHGFDIDFCRALSAALFDGVDRSLFVHTDYTLRWKTLQSKQADVLTVSSSLNVERDVNEPSTGVGFSFTDMSFFSWQGFGGLPEYVECAENQDVVSPHCQDLKVCTYEGTSFYDNVVELLGNDFYVEAMVTYLDMVAGLRDGVCNVIYDFSGQIQERSVRANGYEGDQDTAPYVVGMKIYPLDPSGFVTRQEDPLWSDFVRWVFRALVYAEAEEITQASAELMPKPTVFGPLFSNVFYYAVNAVGNYGEIYERNLGLRLGQNLLNDNRDARIFALPVLTTS